MDSSHPSNNAALELASLSPVEQEEALLTAGDLIFKESLVRLAERMDDSMASELETLLDKGASDEEIAAFIEERVPGADEAVQGAVDEVVGAILSDKP